MATTSSSSSSSSPRTNPRSNGDKSSRKYHPNAPQIFAALRDHRDWIRRKNGQLAALRLAGCVDSLQKQLEEHKAFKNELEDRRPTLLEDCDRGREIGELSDDARDCLEKLTAEWAELNGKTDVWQNKIDNALANMRIFEKDIHNFNERLTKSEDVFLMWRDDPLRKRRTPSVVNGDAGSLADDDHDLLQRLSVQVNEMAGNMAELKEQSERLPYLSQSVSAEIDKIEDRLSNLREDLDRVQWNTLSPERRMEGGPTPMEFQSTLPPGWERGTTAKEHIPYYLCHADERTQWDHPAYTELMNQLLELNAVKYSAYKLALKLRKVQQRLCLDLLELEAAKVGFESHGLTQERHDMTIRVPEMCLVLSSLYQTLAEVEPADVRVPLCVDLCLNWLLNVYDGARSGQIRVLSFKVGILVLCRGPLTEKYLNLFKLVARDKRADPRQLGLLLYDTIQFPRVLGEVAAFGGSNVEPSVRSCFTLTSSEPVESVDAKHFLKWLRQEPQSLVWLPVLHRLAAAELAKHNVKCKACKAYPMVGFRYHCLKCFNFDLCHNCFFVGATAKGHKADHPMQEYCTPTGASINLKNLGQSLRNSFRSKNYFKKKQKKLGYLPVNSVLEGEDYSTPNTLSPNLSLESSQLLHGSHNGSLQPKLINNLNVTSSASSAVGNNNSNGVVGDVGKRKESEHDLIARFCRALDEEEEDAAADDDDDPLLQDELKERIHELEQHNQKLSAEYEELQRDTGVDEDVIQRETEELKQSSERMETRMHILEDHNRQLVAQLSRLRQLLQSSEVVEDKEGQRRTNNFGTLQSRSVVAAELFKERTPEEEIEFQDSRRRPPGSEEFLATTGKYTRELENLMSSMQHEDDDDDDVTRKEENNEEDSLGLSDHETQTVSD